MRLALLALLALALLAAGCGASAVAAVEGRKFGPAPGYSRAEDGDTDGDDGNCGGDQDGDDDDDDQDDGDDDDDQDGDDDDDQDGDDDDDQDGDDDATGCEGFELRVTNDGVTAARVAMNGVELVSPNDFPTSDALVSGFTAVDGENLLWVWLAGSPGDQIFVEVASPDGTVLVAQTVTRQTGKPEEASLTLSAACGG